MRCVDVYDAYTYEEVMAMTPQERRGLDEKELGQLLGQEDKFYKVRGSDGDDAAGTPGAR